MKRLKVNGIVVKCTASSLFTKLTLVPPPAGVASINVKTSGAVFALGEGSVIVKVPASTATPKTFTNSEPVVAPNGTTVSILVRVELTIRPDCPLKSTSTFCDRMSKLDPSIVTSVEGGPLDGATWDTVGGGDV